LVCADLLGLVRLDVSYTYQSQPLTGLNGWYMVVEALMAKADNGKGERST
jgi:hypothetical protein